MKKICKHLLCIALILALLGNGSTLAFATQDTGSVAVNTTTQQVYDDVSIALLSASNGDTVRLNQDTSATILTILSGTTLDLNGCKLDATYTSCFGHIVDSSDAAAGLLNVTKEHFLIQKSNSQLPVCTSEGYRFLDVTKFNATYVKSDSKFAFQPFIDAAGHSALISNPTATGVSIRVRAFWTQAEDTRSQDFIYNANLIAAFLNSYYKTGDTEKYSQMFSLTVTDAEKFANLTFQAVVCSDTGVEFGSEPISSGGQNDDDAGNEGGGNESTTPSNVLIANEEFLYGSYFDHDRVGHNNRITSGSYGAIKSADALHPAQDITVKVTDTDLSNYKVTLGYFDKDGNYTGRTGILPMVDGELTIRASEMTGKYFRVNVYIYTGRFPKVPESAQIVVYKGLTAQPEQPEQPETPDTPSDPDSSERPWENKKIAILGDSISTGSYPGILANMTGATLQNLSVSGTLLAGGLTGKVADIASDADLVIVFGGTNDYWHKNVQIGEADSTDARTYVGALRYILNSLKTNHPNAKYLFVFPPDQTFGGNPSSTDFGKGTLDDFRAAFLKFCAENHVPYVNLADTEFDSSKHSGDGVHPNTTGHQIIAQAIYDKIADGLKTSITVTRN